MRRELVNYLLSIIAITGSMFGCTVYDDDNGESQDQPSNGRIESPSGENNTLLIGGARCSDGNECQSGECQNSVCTCNTEVSCQTGMYCNTVSSLCKNNKLDGDACSSNKECGSGLCEGGFCSGCHTSSDCQENNVCVNASCEPVVACPGNENKTKRCFKTMHITPNANWVGSSLNESTIDDEDFLGSILTPVLPNAKDDNIQFCIRPIMGILTTDFKTTTSQKIKDIINDADVTTYLQTLILDNLGPELFAKLLPEIQNDTTNQTLESLFGTDYAQYANGVDQLLADPRITQRLNSKGCVILPVQRENTSDFAHPVPFIYRLNDSNSKWAGHSIYMKGIIKNSGLMTEKTRFTVSLEAKPEVKTYDEQAISYKSVVSFPIGYTQTMTMANYDTTTTKQLIARFDGSKLIGDDYKFFFKINDITATESTFACDEYDISSGICPGTVQKANNGYLSINSKCSKNDNYTSNGFSNCVPKASFVLDHIEIYVELGEDD